LVKLNHQLLSGPSVQASNIKFRYINPNKVNISWRNGNGVKRVVFVYLDSIAGKVTNYTKYKASPSFWGCIYNGIDTVTQFEGIAPGSTITASVFEYEGNSGFEIYNKSTSIDNPKSFTTPKIDQVLTFQPFEQKLICDSDFKPNASSSSGLEITYSSSNDSVAQIISGLLHITGVGSAEISAHQDGNQYFNAATPISQILTVNKGTTHILVFDPLPAKVFGDIPFKLYAKSLACMPVRFTSSNTSVAVINGNEVTIIGAGSTDITVTESTDIISDAATPVFRTLNVSKANQTISFNTIQPQDYGSNPFELNANASSGLPVTFTSSNTEIATIEGNKVTIKGAGSTSITAFQAGNSNYNSISIIQTLIINKATQEIIFDAVQPNVFGNDPFDLKVNTSSGLPVAFTSSNTEIATIEGNKVTIRGAGSSAITALQAGNSNFISISATQTLIINKANQSITFELLEDHIISDSLFELCGISSSGMPISYTSSNLKVAEVNRNIVKLISPGKVDITAFQEGNQNFNAAKPVTQTLNILPVTSVYEVISDLLNIYPNPTNDRIIIEFINYSISSECRIKIVNNLGMIVYSRPVSQPVTEIFMNQLGGKGTYFLILYDKLSDVMVLKKIVLI
jgi:hypothetical protein